MINLLGEYEIAIDAKGRFLLPAGLRKQFPDGSCDKFVINRGIENCLNLYTMDEWQIISARINELDEFDADARKFKRWFLNGATIVEADSADRLLLPKPLQERVGIVKDAVLSAQGNKVEIWDKDTYYNVVNTDADDYSMLAQKVMTKKQTTN